MDIGEPQAYDGKRKPWIAVLLSLLQPGLGQLYNGQPQKAYWLIRSFILIGVMAYTAGVFFTDSIGVILSLSSIFYVFIFIFAIVDGWRNAKRLGRNYYLRRYNHWLVYGALIIFPYAIRSSSAQFFRTNYLEPFVVPTDSMAPILISGDRFYADKRVNLENVRRGDLYLIKAPYAADTILVKRLLGIPGDKIKIKAGEIILNGTLLKHQALPYASSSLGPTFMQSHTFFSETVDRKKYVITFHNGQEHEDYEIALGPGEVFFIGDNRHDSHDSRQFGSLSVNDIVGKPLLIWFSHQTEPLGIRWERIGQRLDG